MVYSHLRLVGTMAITIAIVERGFCAYFVLLFQIHVTEMSRNRPR